MRYTAFGETRYTSQTETPTDYLFTGQRIEEEAGLYYYVARFYDASINRWIQPDSIIQNVTNQLAYDRYAYVAQNPMKYVDTSGHCWGIASFVRGLPTYGTTCSNLDMALTILQSDQTSTVDKVAAGAYVAVEGTAHVALAVGSAMLACSAVTPCATTATSVLNLGKVVCADGDCTNEANATAQNLKSVWDINPFKRGIEIENLLGRSPELGQNFPVIDRWENGIATSIKSIDLTAKSYQNISTLTRTVQGYVNTLANWQGTKWGGVVIKGNEIFGRQLLLAIPQNASQAQLQALQLLQQSSLKQGVELILKTIK